MVITASCEGIHLESLRPHVVNIRCHVAFWMFSRLVTQFPVIAVESRCVGCNRGTLLAPKSEGIWLWQIYSALEVAGSAAPLWGEIVDDTEESELWRIVELSRRRKPTKRAQEMIPQPQLEFSSCDNQHALCWTGNTVTFTHYVTLNNDRKRLSDDEYIITAISQLLYASISPPILSVETTVSPRTEFCEQEILFHVHAVNIHFKWSFINSIPDKHKSQLDHIHIYSVFFAFCTWKSQRGWWEIAGWFL